MKKKVKALFQIVLLILSLFSISLLSEPASAGEDVCCEKTKDGEMCKYTDSSNCDSDKRSNPSTCEQTSFCQLGCCFDPNKNTFSKNVPLATCEENKKHNENLIFSVGDTDCAQALSTFPRGCCVIADQCTYTTNQNCKKIAFDYDTESEFQNVISEFECVNICRQNDEGCCISQEGCRYTTRNDCVGSETSIADFNYQQYCSSFDSCLCKPRDHKACYENNVYWFDSCGNREEIVKECRYEDGVKCGSIDGEMDCKSLDCTITPDENNPLEFFPDKKAKNGESWCLYDSLPGPTLDLVGSRHYRIMCVEGEEITETCRDFREEFCIQADLQTSEGEFREAACRKNRFEDCTTECNKAVLPPSSVDSEEAAKREEIRYKRELAEDKKCCENTDIRDCVWLGSGGKGAEDSPIYNEESSGGGNSITGSIIELEDPLAPSHSDVPSISDQAFNPDSGFSSGRGSGHLDYQLEPSGEGSVGSTEGGVCVPLVPQGNRFWESEGECDIASRECNVVWAKGWTLGSWGCESGCDCEKQDFLQGSNAYCRGVGDCGAHYNYQGGYSDEGFGFHFEYNDINKNYPKGLNKETFDKFSVTKRGLFLGEIPLTGISGFQGPGMLSSIAGYTATTLGTMALSSIVAGASWGVALAVPVFGAIAAAVIWFLTFGADRKDLTHTTSCSEWQAPSGGGDCSKCDENPLKPCSEYRCKSLGQLCAFIPENEGTNRPTCVNQHPNDANTPIITPWPENLTKPYKLDIQSSGFEITPAIKPFEEITMGIKTNEPAQCKIDEDIKDYDTMLNFFGNQYYETEHSITINLHPGNEITYYVKCKDIADNKNTVPYIIKLKTQKGPDLTPPIIEGTDLTNPYVAAHLESKVVSIFINEPVTCKYSDINQGYVEMQNQMQCSQSINNAFMSKYKCMGNLPIAQGDNTFYFTCKDNEGNTNSDPVSLKLIGTESLNITHTEPTGELPYSDVTLKVTTSKGAEQGKATCSYDGIIFFNTNSSQHTQELNLTKGNYNYNIFCEDIAGNTAEETISFGVLTDEKFSEIYYIYKDSSSIHLVLDEATICKYSEKEFNFDTEGIDMAGQDKEHSMPTGLGIYHVICEDQFKNKMPTIIIYS